VVRQLRKEDERRGRAFTLMPTQSNNSAVLRPSGRAGVRYIFCYMTNRFGVELHPKDVRWAAAEGVSQDVIAAVLLLHERSVDEIAPQLTATELEQTIVLVGRFVAATAEAGAMGHRSLAGCLQRTRPNRLVNS
jgi:hypothetical protein